MRWMLRLLLGNTGPPEVLKGDAEAGVTNANVVITQLVSVVQHLAFVSKNRIRANKKPLKIAASIFLDSLYGGGLHVF